MRLGTTAFPPPAGASPREALSYSISRARALDVKVLNAPLPRGMSNAEMAQLRDELDAAGLELEPSILVNYCSTGDEAQQVRDSAIGVLHDLKRLGMPRLRTMANRKINRFTKPKPKWELHWHERVVGPGGGWPSRW